jgi:hypothetical protein
MIVFDDVLDVAQVAFSKSAFAFNSDGLEPELRFIPALVDVNVRRFAGYIRFIEIEFITIHAKDNRHGNSNVMKDEIIIALPLYQNP